MRTSATMDVATTGATFMLLLAVASGAATIELTAPGGISVRYYTRKLPRPQPRGLLWRGYHTRKMPSLRPRSLCGGRTIPSDYRVFVPVVCAGRIIIPANYRGIAPIVCGEGGAFGIVYRSVLQPLVPFSPLVASGQRPGASHVRSAMLFRSPAAS